MGREVYTIFGAGLLEKKIQKYEYKIRNVSEYLFMDPSEGACASQGP